MGCWCKGSRGSPSALRAKRPKLPQHTKEAEQTIAAYSFASRILADDMVPLEEEEHFITTAFYNMPSTTSVSLARTLPVPMVFDLDVPPATRRQMLLRPDRESWRAAERLENEGLFGRGVFERVVGLPKGRYAIRLKYVYDRKVEPSGALGKYKARLVVQGNNVHADKTYAPVARTISIRIVLAWSAKMDWELFTFNVKQAFLNAPLVEDVYDTQIPGYPDLDPRVVYRLLRALYGLPQAPNAWYGVLRGAMEALGFVRLACDAAVFYGKWLEPPPGSNVPMPPNGEPLQMIVPVHVDDGLVSTNSILLYAWFIAAINSKFETIDQGPVSAYVSLRIMRDRKRRLLWISQELYIDELLEQHNLTDGATHNIPLGDRLKETKLDEDSSVPEVDSGDIPELFQASVGWLLFLAIFSRPDIVYTTMALAQHNAKPKRHHLKAAKGVLRYLHKTKSWALQYGGDQRKELARIVGVSLEDAALSDADWGSHEVDQKSVSGFALFLYGGLVSWSAVKQKSVALSSTESEYMALTHVLKEVLWVWIFLNLVELPIPRPFPLLSDNRSSLDIANSDSTSSRSKHIDIRYHFIRAHIEEGSVATHWISTTDMIADIFTKGLPADLHYKHCASLGMVPR